MAELPTGTITFLFTDIQGSTRAWDERPIAMQRALALHDELLQRSIDACGGRIVKTTGDGVHAVFATADAGVLAAVGAQRALTAQDWGEAGGLLVRMGLHTGAAEARDGDYYGTAVNRAARLMAAAHGGQVVCSHTTAQLARDALPDDVTLVELGEHRLRDLARPEEVFQVNGAGLGVTFAPLTTVAAAPGNLPPQLTSLVGRQRELARTIDALDASRVVTLTGVGGVGKTRLALQVAADLVPRFRHGAWLCELAAVRTTERVAEAVAAVFQLTTHGNESTETALVEFLGPKELLVVLDNCEHVLEESAALAETIERACPDVRVLATSREGLGIDGERIVAVPSLPAPADGASLDEIRDADAVQLFAERARARNAEFDVTADNATAIATICRRLDGMPLAIELAAARVPAMNPRELLERLDRRFEVLAGGGRGRVERHQTLRAVIDWSYDLLDPDAQLLLARTTVFNGGWTLDAAETVCSGPGLAAASVLPLTERLVARSLVIADDLGFQTRYRLLETIRQYGEERLAERDETADLRHRHVEYYLASSAVLSDGLWGPEQLDYGRRLLADRENVLSAVATVVDGGDVDAAMQFIRALPGPAAQLGRQVRLPLDAILAMPGAGEHADYPFALATSGFAAALTGDLTIASERAAQLDALEARRITPFDRDTQVFMTGSRMTLAFSRGAWADAAVIADENLARHRAMHADGTRPTGMLASWLASTASIHGTAGNEDVAIEMATEALTLSRGVGMPTAIAMSLSSLAGGLAAREPQRAAALLRESTEVRARLGYETANEIAAAVLVAARLREWPLALDLCARAVPLVHWVGDRPQLAGLLNVVARAVAEPDPETAALLLGATRRLALSSISSLGGGAPAVAPGTSADPFTRLRRETSAIVIEAVGDDTRRRLREHGEQMETDEAVHWALDAIDEQLAAGAHGTETGAFADPSVES